MGRDALGAEASGASLSVLLKAETLAGGEQECPPGPKPVTLESQEISVLVSNLSLARLVTLDETLVLPGPQFPHLDAIR